MTRTAANLQTIRSFCGRDGGRAYWMPLPDECSNLLDLLLEQAKATKRVFRHVPDGDLDRSTESYDMLLGPERAPDTVLNFYRRDNGDISVSFAAPLTDRSHLSRLWGLDPYARRLNDHWYLLCTPEDGRGLAPTTEIQLAIADLEEIAAIEPNP